MFMHTISTPVPLYLVRSEDKIEACITYKSKIRAKNKADML